MMAGQVGDVGICGIVWNNVIIVTALLSPEPPREVRGASASAGAGRGQMLARVQLCRVVEICPVNLIRFIYILHKQICDKLY